MTATSDFQHSSGFHPIYTTCISLDHPRDYSLHILYSLPPDVYVDPYELQNYRDAYSFQLVGTVDLESPVVWADPHDSTLFTNVTLSGTQYNQVCVDMPIHLRYGRPSNNHSHESITIPCPSVFRSYPNSKQKRVRSLESFLFNVDLFEIPSKCNSVLQLPVGDTNSLNQVQIITASVILIVFYYCVRKSVTTFLRLQSSHKLSKMQ